MQFKKMLVLGILGTAVCSIGIPAHAAMNLAAGAKEISESGSYAANPGVPSDTSQYGGQNVTDGGDSTPASLGTSNPGYVPVTEVSQGFTYWLPPQDQVVADPVSGANTLGWVTIDLGAAVNIGEIDLFNVRNACCDDRATDAFHINASNAVDANGNLVGGAQILSGTLTDSRGQPGGLINPDFFTGSLGTYRYVQFVIDSAYSTTYNGDSGGLDEIRVYGSTPEPASLGMIAVGSLGLLARRRRA